MPSGRIGELNDLRSKRNGASSSCLRNAEPVSEGCNIGNVFRLQLVAEMRADLVFGRPAADLTPADVPEAGTSLSRNDVYVLGWAVDAVAGVVQDDDMEVDLTAARFPHHEVPRSGVVTRNVAKAGFEQRLAKNLRLRFGDNDVVVRVRTGLLVE